MQIFETPTLARAALGPSVATIGKYDGMHLGHQRILDNLLGQSKRLGLPAVVILSEPQPEEFFTPLSAPPRLNHFQDKVDFLTERGVDAVLRLRFDAELSQIPAEVFVQDFLVQQLGFKVLVIGDDFRFGKNRHGDLALLQRLAKEQGFVVQSVAACHSEEERVSSTLVRHYLQNGNCQRVAQLLGRPYSIGGTVIRGRQLGRQLGVPTANVGLVSNSLPMTGVFAVRVDWNGCSYQGVANLGFKPTVNEQPVPSLEVHLLKFDQDLYDSHIRVFFLQKLRDEKKFSGLDQLKLQIELDLAEAVEIFKATTGNRIAAGNFSV